MSKLLERHLYLLPGKYPLLSPFLSQKTAAEQLREAANYRPILFVISR